MTANTQEIFSSLKSRLHGMITGKLRESPEASMLRLRIFKCLLRGDEDNAKDLEIIYGDAKPTTNKYPVRFSSPYFIVAIYQDMDDTLSEPGAPFRWNRLHEEAARDYAINNTVNYYLSQHHEVYHFVLDGVNCTLLNISGFDECDGIEACMNVILQIKHKLTFICDELDSKYGIHMSAVISSIYKTCEKIPYAFREATYLNKSLISCGFPLRTVSYFDCWKNRWTKKNRLLLSNLEKRYFAHVIDCDFENSETLLIEIVKLILNVGVTFDQINQYGVVDYIVFVLRSQQLNIRDQETDAFGVLECAHKLQIVRSLPESFALVSEFFSRITTYYEHSLQGVVQKVTLVVEYMQANYKNPLLDLALICEENEISSSYLSKLFRDELGAGVIWKLNEIRIKEAKALLRDTVLNLDAISLRCGYNSRRSFVRSFKRYTGITPGTYREQSAENG